MSTNLRARLHHESVTIGAGYFWYYGAVGAFVPYAALYYRSLGFSGMELGLLTALPSIGTALTGPFWGIIADTYGWHRQVMRVVLIAAAVLALILAQLATFVPFMVALALLALFLVPIPSLWDSYAVSVVERGGHPYGMLRIFGSLGFTFVVTIMGMVVADGISNIIFFVYPACLLVTCGVAFGLPKLGERVPRKMFDGMRTVFTTSSYVLLLATAYLIAVGYAMLSVYLALHIESLGGSSRLVGLAFAVSALSELPVLIFSGAIMTKLGPRRVILVAITSYFVRFAVLGLTGSAVVVLLSQAVHGLSFGMFLVASVLLAHRLVGRSNAATAQALLAMVGIGMGNITGSILGGVVIDHTTTANMYKGVAVLMLATLGLFVAGSHRLGKGAFDAQPA